MLRSCTGFDAQTAPTDEFVEICERAENKEALRSNKARRDHDDSSDDERPRRKTMKKHCTSEHTKSKRLPFYCKEHGPNTTHDSKDCKVLNGTRKEPNDWKKKNTSNSTDYKSKYKKKTRELNLLQLETKKEKAKWMKAYKKLTKPAWTDSVDLTSDGKVSKHSDSLCSRREPNEFRCELDISEDISFSSSSSSASDTDSE